MKLCASKKNFAAVVVTTVSVYLVYALLVTPSPTLWMPVHLMKTMALTQSHVIKFPETKALTNINVKRKILLWTKWFGRSRWNLDFTDAFDDCEFSNCELTINKRELNDSDAVLFHVGDMPRTYQSHFMPAYHKDGQVWILQTSEPPPNIKTDLSAYINVFNWTATYRKDSDIYMPYTSIIKRWETLKKVQGAGSSKSKLVAWVASNCGDHARRQMLVRELRKFIHVDTFGECGERELSRSLTTEVLSKYKFYLAFESAYCVDYVTEKFGAALARHQIPVVSGAADYQSMAPPNSFINVLDFDSVEHLAQYIKFLDSNDTAYDQYLQWTKDYKVDNKNYMDRGMCEICRRLHDVAMPPQVYPDVEAYVRHDTCPKWSYLDNKYRSIQGWLIHFGYV